MPASEKWAGVYHGNLNSLNVARLDAQNRDLRDPALRRIQASGLQANHGERLEQRAFAKVELSGRGGSWEFVIKPRAVCVGLR